MEPLRPADLIPLDAAAVRVDRSRSTLRGWIRAGALAAWPEDPTRPENTRVLVSTAALLQLVVVSGKVARPGRRPSPGAAPPDLRALEVEADTLAQALRGALAAQIETLEARVADLERLHASTAARTADWRARAEQAEAARHAFASAGHAPWWVRLLGTRKA